MMTPEKKRAVEYWILSKSVDDLIEIAKSCIHRMYETEELSVNVANNDQDDKVFWSSSGGELR
jgi:hypothetical protein